MENETIELLEKLMRKAQKQANNTKSQDPFHNDLKNLTPIEFQTINVIGIDKHRTMKDIATELGVSVSTPTTTIDRLVEKDLVKREVGTADRRHVLVSLTQKGENIYKRAWDFKCKKIEFFFSILSEEEKIVIKNVLNKLDNLFK